MTPEAIIRAYESGRIVRDHAVSELCRIAVDLSPATLADRLPDEFLNEIRTMTTNIPRPEELVSLFGGMRVPGTDVEAWQWEQDAGQVRWVEGLRAWQAYFKSME